MSKVLFELSLGESRCVKVKQHGEETFTVEICHEETGNGQDMSLSRWKNFCDSLEEIVKTVQEMKGNKEVNMRIHLGGHVYVSVCSPYKCVNIRQWVRGSFGDKPLLPTSNGVSLKFAQWEFMTSRLPEINFQLPVDLDSVVPCQFADDHANQLGMLRCSECNPDGYRDYINY
ncbi:hypothetical protein FSP39_019666 [Pinctada imbricata]|uniref:Uncharacterized protein n=1 Tax=Pinctada imbricata TaxID=66713 RepID=A0AA89BXW8_PINIB|nr:hypothetical protein FSP39_019666 [Pinctada imbricata]